MLTNHFVRWNENKMLRMYLVVFVIFLNKKMFGSQIVLGLQHNVRFGQETGNIQIIFYKVLRIKRGVT